jgi:hypothetical protein
MSRDYYDRREEERRWRRAEDLRREHRRADMLAEQRRRDWQREDERRAERRREDLRREAREAVERRRRREADEEAQKANRGRGISLLRDGFTNWGAAVLGIDPALPPPPPSSAAPAPKPPPARFDWNWLAAPAQDMPTPLATPLLLRTEEPDGRTHLTWLPVIGAAGYLVEESISPSFAFAIEIYRGEKTEHLHGVPLMPVLGVSRPGRELFFYRVRALGGPGAADSAWSNVT